MTQNTPDFAPFMPQPTTDAPPLQPQTDSQPPKRTRKNARKKARIIITGVNVADNGLISPKTIAEAKKSKATRKPRTPKPGKPLPKYDLQTILKVASTLKEPDQKAFEGLLGELSALPKASRVRVLAALQQVFG